VNLKSKAYVLC